jgi:TRAP-type C4-dicarboxylate transport system permease small subunit
VNRWREFLARLCGLIAAVFLAAMMLLTVADVTLRAAFNLPIRGVYELIELLLAGTFFIALPAVFLRNEQIIVNVIDGFAPRAVPLLERCSYLLAVVMLGLMAWQGWIAATDAIEFHDVTADLGISRIWHWIALLVGIVAAAIASLAMALRRSGAP